MEGSSVTLTCSSDANPAATYTWYKRSGDKQVQLLSEETQFVLSSIRSSDSGEYNCTAENELGRSSANISITVKCEWNTGYSVKTYWICHILCPLHFKCADMGRLHFCIINIHSQTISSTKRNPPSVSKNIHKAFTILSELERYFLHCAHSRDVQTSHIHLPAGGAVAH